MKSHPLALALLPILAGSLSAAESGHGSGAGTTEIAPASNEGENAIKTFKFDPGLKCELWAAEPMVANPVAFSQDEKGRWYVAETFRQERGVEDDRGHANWLDTDLGAKSVEDRLAMIHKFYPDAAKFAEKFTKFEDRIRRLEDTTGSGRADKVTTFADGFNDPLDGTGAGILARGNEVWYTCIPNLWRFRDTNDDGIADTKEKLLTGFGVKFAFRGHDMHGLRFGPDGKLYWSIGDRAVNVVSKEGPTVAETETGTILRSNPDGTGFEIFATGVRNPQELAFDEFGNLFTGDNNSDSGDKARFVYLVEGGDCGWRMAFQYLPDRGPWNREKLWDEKLAPKARYLVPPIANVGNGPSGLTYNPGTGLGEYYRRQFYLSDFRGGANTSSVHQIGLEPQGAFFKVKHDRDFVKGVLTTDVEFSNDGSLYVLDWVASWGGVGKGRIYKFTLPGPDEALQKETEKLIRDGMSKRAEPELAQLLGHADMRVQQAAQFELAERAAKPATFVAAARVLVEAARNPKPANPLSRLHGIWGLGQLGERDLNALFPAVSSLRSTASVLVPLLADATPEVRAQAAKVLGDLRVKAAGDKLTALLKDKESRVRCFAAISLGRLGHAPAAEPLFTVLEQNSDADPILRHGAVMGLVGCATPQQLAGKVNSPSAAMRGGAVVALRRLKSPLVAAFLNDADESVVLEAARAIHDVPIDAALPALATLTASKTLKDPLIFSRAINAHYRLGKLDNARALAAFAADSSFPEAARKDALDALGEWANPDAKDRVLNQWRPLPARGGADAVAAVTPAVPGLLKDSAGPIQEMVAKLAAKLTLSGVGEPLFLLASNDKANLPARLEAIKSLAALKDSHLAQIAKVAVSDKNPKVRSEGLQALAGADPTAAVKVIGELVNTGAPLERQGAILALAQIKGPAADALLASLLDQLLAGQAPAEVQLDILEAASKSSSAAVKTKVAKYQAGFKAGDDLAPYRVSLAGGDVERGRKLFREQAQVQCLRCHKNEIGDSVVGPELTHIGATKDRAYLLESIVQPNKVIAQGFQIVVLTLTDGNVVAGRLLGEDASALKVETLDAQAKPQATSVPVAKIKSRDSAPSAMPGNMMDFLSKSDLRDLVEYLATRK